MSKIERITEARMMLPVSGDESGIAAKVTWTVGTIGVKILQGSTGAVMLNPGQLRALAEAIPEITADLERSE